MYCLHACKRNDGERIRILFLLTIELLYSTCHGQKNELFEPINCSPTLLMFYLINVLIVINLLKPTRHYEGIVLTVSGSSNKKVF